MQEFNEGDLVEATRTDATSSTRFIGILALAENANGVKGLVLKAQGYQPMAQWLEDHGFEFTLIERAAPKLPSEPGSYVDRNGAGWTITANSDWRCGHKYTDAREAIGFAPFTPVEPVPVTAKRVLDRVKAASVSQPANPTRAWELHLDSIDIAGIAAEFGVTE